MAASIWYCLSWKTLSSVAFCSSLVSFSWIWKESNARQSLSVGINPLYLVNLDLVESVGEVLIVGESVSIIDVFTFWYLGQDSRFATSQRLENFGS